MLTVTPERDQLLPGQATDVDGGYSHVQFRVQQDGAWTELSAGDSACIEIELPAEVCVARRTDGLPLSGYQSISVEPNPEVLTKLLALFTDHVDLLLEDWYPSLGTRFVHTSEGRCLITRLVPCPACLRAPAPAPPPHHLLPQV
ncbi:unnamed protein product [Plutella xylostella]|uniref:(diamondback moth) hypothetical protein n=1 Tax=Plutella xylostella TaxID=51655 RepID=A0A8S4GF76_PLUXY|nr:unnamed protein product [Plutella xylostella]